MKWMLIIGALLLFSLFGHDVVLGIFATVIIACIFVLLRILKKSKEEKELQIEEPKEQDPPEEIEEICEEAEGHCDTEIRSYEVAGVGFYLNNLLSMMEPNYLYSYKKQDLVDTCNYDIPIYKTVCNATKLELLQEDDNPHDPNAVLVLLNQKIVGYIPRKDCKHVRHLMDNDLVVSFNCTVYGGKYKQVNEDYDWEKDKSTYSMETGEDEYGITITIKEKLA